MTGFVPIVPAKNSLVFFSSLKNSQLSNICIAMENFCPICITGLDLNLKPHVGFVRRYFS